MTRQYVVLSLAGVIAAAMAIAVVRFKAVARWLDYVLMLALIGTGALLVLVAAP
jgi:hypothetical protein